MESSMAATLPMLLASIEALAPRILANADQSDAMRHLAPESAQAMAAAGLYRVAVPRSLGGFECHPVDQIKVIEAVADLHGSSGWNLMIGIEVMGILGAVYRRDVMAQLYEDPLLIIAGTLNPLGTAVRVDGGYRISGQWPFASGVHNARYFWSQSVVHEGGEPLKDERGIVLCESMVPISAVEILDTWHVSGLRGSGSHDVRLTDVLVADEFISQVARTRPFESGTLYRLPLYSRLAYNKVGVATGIARAALRHFTVLANEKKPRGSSAPLSHRADAQRAMAEASRVVGAARSYVFETVSDLYSVVERGEKPTVEQRALVQLACSGAATDCVRAVEMLYSAAGASVNFLTSPLERCMRDVMVVRQHIMVSP
jgi:indole-3-acetate monooxygenase